MFLFKNKIFYKIQNRCSCLKNSYQGDWESEY